MGNLLTDQDPIRYAADIDAVVIRSSGLTWLSRPRTLQEALTRNRALLAHMDDAIMAGQLPPLLRPAITAMQLCLAVPSGRRPTNATVWLRTLSPYDLVRWAIWLADQTTQVEALVLAITSAPFEPIPLPGAQRLSVGVRIAYPESWPW